MTSSRPRFSNLGRACRIAAVLGLAWGPLYGCSSDSNEDWPAVFQLALTSWGARNANVSLDRAAAIPYATLGVRIGDDVEQILVLVTETQHERLWASAPHLALSTRGGRLVRTAGLAHDMSGLTTGGGPNLYWTEAHDISWTADFVDLGLYAVSILCRDEPEGPDPVTILGKQIATIRVREDCRSEQLDWTYTNTFWVAPDSGRVWRSVQHVSPKGDVLDMEILRPPETPD